MISLETIKKELVAQFIKTLREQHRILTTWGDFHFNATFEQDKTGSIGYLKIGEKWNEFFKLEAKEHKFGFWYEKKTPEKELENDLYHAFREYELYKKEQEQVKKYEKMLNMFPPERKKQFMREQKLGRIINEENND